MLSPPSRRRHHRVVMPWARRPPSQTRSVRLSKVQELGHATPSETVRRRRRGRRHHREYTQREERDAAVTAAEAASATDGTAQSGRCRRRCRCRCCCCPSDEPSQRCRRSPPPTNARRTAQSGRCRRRCRGCRRGEPSQDATRARRPQTRGARHSQVAAAAAAAAAVATTSPARARRAWPRHRRA